MSVDIDLETILELLIEFKYAICDVCDNIRRASDLKIRVFSSNHYIIQCYNCVYNNIVDI